MADFNSRYELGEICEKIVEAFLSQYGIQIHHTGVEHQDDESMKENRMCRWAPDIFFTLDGEQRFVEVKSGKNVGGRCCVDRDCYQVCGQWNEDCPVYFAFVFDAEIRFVKYEEIVMQNIREDWGNSLPAADETGLWRIGSKTFGSGKIFGVIDWNKTKCRTVKL